jgi:hypothetical protein
LIYSEISSPAGMLLVILLHTYPKSEMENITDVSIHIDDHSILYHVTFQDGVYNFKAKENGASLASFNLCREHAEWIAQEPLDEKIKVQAERHLERYLLSQH